MMYNPELSDYQLTSIIGQCCGGVAVVYSAVYKPNGQHVAIKRVFVDKTQENANLIQREIWTTKKLQHPNILPCLTSFVHGRELYAVSPLQALGSCRDVLARHFRQGLPEPACALVLREVLQGLLYLHRQGYIHRGIRASHVLLGSSGSVQLAGLRSAASLMARGRRQRQLHSLPPPNHDNTNLIWLSPELLEQNLKGYDERSDVYSVGVLSCELGNGAVPFSDVPGTLMLTEKMRGSRPQLLDCSTFPADTCIQDNELKSMYNTDSGVGDSVASGSALHMRQVYTSRKFSEQFHHFSELCLLRDPDKRPSVTQLLSHSFFKQIRKTDCLPSLIRRVTPIEASPGDVSALQLEERVSELEVERGMEWDF